MPQELLAVEIGRDDGRLHVVVSGDDDVADGGAAVTPYRADRGFCPGLVYQQNGHLTELGERCGALIAFERVDDLARVASLNLVPVEILLSEEVFHAGEHRGLTSAVAPEEQQPGLLRSAEPGYHFVEDVGAMWVPHHGVAALRNTLLITRPEKVTDGLRSLVLQALEFWR